MQSPCDSSMNRLSCRREAEAGMLHLGSVFRLCGPQAGLSMRASNEDLRHAKHVAFIWSHWREGRARILFTVAVRGDIWRHIISMLQLGKRRVARRFSHPASSAGDFYSPLSGHRNLQLKGEAPSITPRLEGRAYPLVDGNGEVSTTTASGRETPFGGGPA